MRYDINKIKDRISVFSLARDYLNLKITRPGDRCVSFRSGADNPTALLINERDWWDFGSDKGGDVIDLYSEAHSKTKAEAIRELAQIAKVNPNFSENEIRWDNLDKKAETYHKQLRDRTYLKKRGLTDETINRLKIGESDGRIYIPYFKYGHVVYFVSRGENPKYKKMEHELGDHIIWGLHTIGRQGSIVIAEGAFDAIVCDQEGFPVLSAITGRFSKEQMKDLVSCCRNREVIICFDYDPQTKAGQKFTIDLADKLTFEGIEVKVKRIVGGSVKVDLNDLYCRGENLHLFFAQTDDWKTERVNAINNKIEFMNFFKKLKRVFQWPDIVELIHLNENFDRIWINEFVKQLKKPMTDDEVLKELAEKYTLLFHEQLGWFEYDSGLWNRKDEHLIKNYISIILNSSQTGPRIASVLSCAKAYFIHDLKPCNMLNMRNGMFNGKEIIAHSSKYYSTIQLNYDYDPFARCPEFTGFIETITDGDEKRMDLIQEMFGYCLLPDCRFQTCFFLIGSGANGKSVLLEVLTEMVGKENVSNVEISALNEPFQRICLFSSMVNIASETHSDVKGTETIFKQIVAGEQINGCYKGKDFLVFKPKCKMISASNDYIESKDLSYGFLRRIRFVDFPVTFTDTSTPKRDRTILSRLLGELPGILNWSLIGLNHLLEQGEFTLTSDQTRMMETFISLSSPIHDFVKDYQIPETWTSRKTVYGKYKDWCIESNTHPFSARKFWVKLRGIVKFEERSVCGSREVACIK